MSRDFTPGGPNFFECLHQGNDKRGKVNESRQPKDLLFLLRPIEGDAVPKFPECKIGWVSSGYDCFRDLIDRTGFLLAERERKRIHLKRASRGIRKVARRVGVRALIESPNTNHH